MANLRSSVTFLTASLGTKWESYSQALLEMNFPECDRVVVDGSSNWDPLYFVEIARKLTTNYVVLVDEDCFVFDRDQLLTLLDSLQADAGTAVLATPDGGTFHRDYNPIACNPYFAIIDRRALVKATDTNDWKNLTYEDVRWIASAEHVSLLDAKRMKYGLSEPYYPFFWAVLRSGFKIRYLIPTVNAELLASELRSDVATRPLLIHMWWLRAWNNKAVEPYLGVAHRGRYELLQQRHLAPHFASARWRGRLLALNAGRRWKKVNATIRRLIRRGLSRA
jgi:hypothetical protein